MTGADCFVSPSVKALGQLAEEYRCLSLSDSAVPPEEGGVTVSTQTNSSASVPTVAGVCTLMITVTATGLEGRPGSPADKRWQGYPWGVDVDGIPMWASSEYNDLAPNSEGIAVGTVQV